MAAQNPKKKFRERYFAVALRISPDDVTPLADFLAQNRKEASFKFFNCVQDNMELFKEAAARSGGTRQAGTRRDVYLLRFPQSQDLVTFLIAHGRRREVRALMKEAILTGRISERTRQRLKKSGRQPASGSKPAETKAWFPESPFKGKPLPSVLFEGDAERVILALMEDAMPVIQSGGLADAAFRYDWLAVPPEQYPEAVRSIPTFDMLRQLGLLFQAGSTKGAPDA